MGIEGFDRNQEALAAEKAKQDRLLAERTLAPVLYLRPGQTMLRVLPPYSSEGVFFKEVYKHRVAISKSDVFAAPCPYMNSGGVDSCPICERGEELFDTKDEATLKLAKELKPRAHYLYNVIVFSGPADAKNVVPEPGKVYVLDVGVSVHRQIFELDQDEATGWANITSTTNGVNLIIKRTGQGLETKYFVSTHGGGRTDIFKWLEASNIDPNSLKLYDLGSVFTPATHDELLATAKKVKAPNPPAPEPTFATAPPAGPVQPPVATTVFQQATPAVPPIPPARVAPPVIPAPPKG